MFLEDARAFFSRFWLCGEEQTGLSEGTINVFQTFRALRSATTFIATSLPTFTCLVSVQGPIGGVLREPLLRCQHCMPADVQQPPR